MSNDENNIMDDEAKLNAPEALPVPNELDVLKARADTMGITYHPSIGVEKLRDKINKKLAPSTAKEEAPLMQAVIKKAGRPELPPESIAARNRRLQKDAARLVRVRVNCMNPNKKEWEGEVFTVGNSIVGTHKKYVPFNNEAGWHIPNIIYKHLLERMCQIFVTKKGPRGNKIRVGKQIKEFSIEVLDALSPAELKDLATQQAMANNLDD